jgi:hypothetical protein
MVYSLFIMLAVLVMLERLEKQLGVALVAFPPPIFAETASVLWFHVTPPSLRENTSGRGGLHIGIFRSS